MSDAFYVIAKAPRPGFAKTRLGHTIGHEPAVVLYRAFLQDLAARFSDSPRPPGWYVTPPDSWSELSPLVGDCGPVLFQGEGDLTERQRELFQRAARLGQRKVVLAAADSPQLEVGTVERAFRSLESSDLVLGPTHDGGYYLIGMREPEYVLSRGVPGEVAMSTGTELESLISGARRQGLSVARLETVFDVDVEEDLRHLRGVIERPDLLATRAALESLGLLHEAGVVVGEDAECNSGRSL